MDNKLSAVSANIASVQNELQQQTQTVVRVSSEELEEIAKRRNSIIIHGMLEPTGDTPEERKAQDEEKIIEMLHELNGDDVSVNSIVRLGKKLEATAAATLASKPRPIKLTLATEQQKEKVLRNSKNLKDKNEKGLDKVFLHQDLTPRQREKRQELVKELKERQSTGQQNLIIINWKMVEKRTRTDLIHKSVFTRM